MLDFDALKKLALDCGFTNCGPLDVTTLEFMEDVRDMCKVCNNYNHSWSCPPVSGTLEENREEVKRFTSGIIVQTVGDLEDSLDWEGMQAAGKQQSESFQKLWGELEKDYPDLLPMGTGGCTLCAKCTYPDEPCRFPDRMCRSMESCGLFVSKVCTDNNIPYNYGPNKIAYTGCFLLE